MSKQAITNSLLHSYLSNKWTGISILAPGDSGPIIVSRDGDPDNLFFEISVSDVGIRNRIFLKMAVVITGPNHRDYHVIARKVEFLNDLIEIDYVYRQLDIHLSENIKSDKIPPVTLLERAQLINKERLEDHRCRIHVFLKDDEFSTGFGFRIIDEEENIVLVDNLDTDLPDHVYYKMVELGDRHYIFGRQHGLFWSVENHIKTICDTVRVSKKEWTEWMIKKYLKENPKFLDHLLAEFNDPAARELKKL